METRMRVYGILIMSLILIFSLIHLGVGIGIIVRNRRFGTMFRPETGLAAYNIVISFLGIIVGAIGLICILTHQKLLGKILAVIAGILGIFALISLIVALIINSKSASYISTQFFNNMNRYTNNSGARNIIDRVQTNYRCCGETTWFDWGRVQLGTTTTTISTTTILTTTTISVETITTTILVQTTPTPPVGTASPVSEGTSPTFSEGTFPSLPPETLPTIPDGTIFPPSGDTTSPSSVETTSTFTAETANTLPSDPASTLVENTTSPSSVETTSVLPVSTTTTLPGNTTSASTGQTTLAPPVGTTTIIGLRIGIISNAKSLTVSMPMYSNVPSEKNTINPLTNSPEPFNRRKRQAASTSNNTIGIQYSNQIFVPTSCCIDQGNSSNNPSQSTCSSATQLYTNGCLRSIVRRANQQDMGIGIINCFMIVLAFTAIPFLFHTSPGNKSRPRDLYMPQLQSMMQFDTNPANYPSIVNTVH